MATNYRAFTLIDILIALIVLGILLSIAIPNYVGIRRHAHARGCIANLMQIQAAKEQWALSNGRPATAHVPAAALFGHARYLPRMLRCPSTGAPYGDNEIGPVAKSPVCPNPTVDGAADTDLYHGYRRRP
jgi:type II secretory pathway pseudopilin PulG